MRIVSLVPSITESLFDFGLTSQEVVGRTKFCIHPRARVSQVAAIGGTKNININKIRELDPDLIIANKEENTKEQVLELMETHRVWLTDIETLEDNDLFLKDLGILLNKEKEAEFFRSKIKKITGSFKTLNTTAAYLIWKNPYMAAGGDTFISNIMNTLGLENVFKDIKRYPQVDLDMLENAEYLFLSTEPYPFSIRHIEEIQKKIPKTKVFLVDGEVFSWYGTHLSHSEKYFVSLHEKCRTAKD